MKNPIMGSAIITSTFKAPSTKAWTVLNDSGLQRPLVPASQAAWATPKTKRIGNATENACTHFRILISLFAADDLRHLLPRALQRLRQGRCSAHGVFNHSAEERVCLRRIRITPYPRDDCHLIEDRCISAYRICQYLAQGRGNTKGASNRCRGRR